MEGYWMDWQNNILKTNKRYIEKVDGNLHLECRVYWINFHHILTLVWVQSQVRQKEQFIVSRPHIDAMVSNQFKKTIINLIRKAKHVG